MRCRAKFYMKDRAHPLAFQFVWGGSRLPTPYEITEVASKQGALTTEDGVLVSWDPERVEWSSVREIPQDDDAKPTTRKIPPPPVERS